MPKYDVFYTAKVTVRAENEEEAEDQANDLILSADFWVEAIELSNEEN